MSHDSTAEARASRAFVKLFGDSKTRAGWTLPVLDEIKRSGCLKGSGNTDPRKAYLQQAAVELTPEATAWLTERLESAFDANGKISHESLRRLDWPDGWGPSSQ
jgi:hypothetical protein